MATTRDGRLSGRRILVVGASKGIGRAIALGADRAGAAVALAARSVDLLDEAVSACQGDDAVALSCDVRHEESCRRTVGEAVAALGGLDALVYSSGTAPFTSLVDASSEDWRNLLETNLIGASAMTKYAVPHLEQNKGHAIYLGSVSTSGTLWAGLGLYTTSKVALAKLISIWQLEHPDVSFTNLIAGPTGKTSFASDVPEDLIMTFSRDWFDKGLVTSILEPEAHADAVVEILSSPDRIEIMTVCPDESGRPVTSKRLAGPTSEERVDE